MPQTYFVDTWYLIAIHDRFDRHHFRARAIHIRCANELLLTHEAVLSEMLAYFSAQGANARAGAVAATRGVLRDLEVITPDRPLFLSALDRYAARPDKEYSLVDCMSMVVMEQRGIQHVLTNDHHFRQAGFTVISDAP